jgi:hypothetical protein
MVSGAEIGDVRPLVVRGDLERRAGARRGLLEDQRDVEAGQPVMAESQLLVAAHLGAELH